jgi:hypothetical protein
VRKEQEAEEGAVVVSKEQEAQEGAVAVSKYKEAEKGALAVSKEQEEGPMRVSKLAGGQAKGKIQRRELQMLAQVLVHKMKILQ